MSVNRIVKFDRRMFKRNLQSPNKRLARIHSRLRFITRNFSASSIVARITAFLFYSTLALSFNFFFRAKTRIGRIFFSQLINCSLIQIQALELEIRTIRTFDFGTFIKIKTEPFHRTQNNLSVFISRTRKIGVFNSKDKLATRRASISSIIYSGPRTSNMKHASWRWRKTDSNTFIFLGHENPLLNKFSYKY